MMPHLKTIAAVLFSVGLLLIVLGFLMQLHFGMWGGLTVIVVSFLLLFIVSFSESKLSIYSRVANLSLVLSVLANIFLIVDEGIIISDPIHAMVVHAWFWASLAVAVIVKIAEGYSSDMGSQTAKTPPSSR